MNLKALQFVTPAQAGVQTSSRRKSGTSSNSLDSGVRRNDKKGPLWYFCKRLVFYVLLTVLMTPMSALAVTTTALPAGGLYNSAQNVTLTADVPSVIFYTTDGTTPTTGSSRYSTPISITSTTTLKFFAIDQNDNVESVNYATYATMSLPSPYTRLAKKKNLLLSLPFL